MSEPSKVLVEEGAEAEENGQKIDDKKRPKRASIKQNDPISRFNGDGVSFRAKLFGTADVTEPRGDNMCNTAMNLLKSAVKTTGEHKQKILLRVNLSGIVIVDLSTMKTIYEHAVNRVSFISKDPTDNRAFGFVVGDKDGKHTYFGIKTEKAAEQVVLTLRDMFQAVFDLKKKEAEMKGKPTTEPSAQQAAEQPRPAEQTAEQTTTPAPKTEEPSIGETTDTQPKEVKREDSQSHLLDLLADLSFDQPQQAPAATSQAMSVQALNANVWATQPAPVSNPAAPWGPPTPAQRDPFTVQQPQVNPFNQPAAQTTVFQSQPQQPVFQANFTQPQQQNVYPPQQQTAFPPQQQTAFPPQQQTAFPPQQQPQNVFTQSQPFTSPPVSSFQQPAAAASPFATQPGMAAPSPFTNDPFATNGFQPTQQQQQPASSNPFASPGNESFGVLQPQQVPQPAPRSNVPQAAQPTNLFSDLNPLPGTDPSVRKDQFFSDIKNPPKPKLNDIPGNQEPAAQTTVNNNFTSNVQSTQAAPDLSWLDQAVLTNVAAPVSDVPVKQGLISPPPKTIRQRQGAQGPAPVSRPR